MRRELILLLLLVAPDPAVARAMAGTESPHTDDAVLVLRGESLGPLPLSPGMSVSLELIERLFPAFDAEQTDGEDDAWSGALIHVSRDGKLLFTLQSKSGVSPDASEFPLGTVIVHSETIPDAYGLKVGQTSRDIVTARGSELEFARAHRDVAIGGDGIFYSLALPCVPISPDNPEACVDRSPENVQREEALESEWVITSITWPTWVW